jgi:hypothetical protein
MTALPAVVTIVDLPAGTTLTGAELIEAVQTVGGAGISIQVALSQLPALGLPINLAASVTGVLGGANMTAVNVATAGPGGIQGTPHFLPTTVLPSGGATTMGTALSSAVNFGIFAGSGLPTLAAATGSLYMRFDGSTATSRLYVNTNGTAGWTAVLASG